MMIAEFESWADFSHWIRFVRDEGRCQDCGVNAGDPAPIPSDLPDHLKVLHEGGQVRLVTVQLTDRAEFRRGPYGDWLALCSTCYARREQGRGLAGLSRDIPKQSRAAARRQIAEELKLKAWVKGK